MQQLEQQYLKALETNLEKEKTKEKIAKQQYINAAKKIQASFKKYKLQIKKLAVKKIIMGFRKYKLRNTQQQVQLRKKFHHKIREYFNTLKFDSTKQIMLQLTLAQKDKLKPLVLFIKNYQKIKRARIRLMILKLIQFRRIQLQQEEAKKIISQYKQRYYREQIQYQQQKIALLNEIEFITNIQQLNNKYFEIGIQNNENEFVKAVQSKNHESDYIELKDQQGITYWQHLKTLKKYDHNPIEKTINDNLGQLRKFQLEQYQEQVQYLEDGKQELIVLLQDIRPTPLPVPKLSVQERRLRFWCD